MTTKHFALFLLALAVLIGCGSSGSPDRLYIYSIDFRDRVTDSGQNDSDRFHGYLVLGKAEVETAADQVEIIDAIERGIKESDGSAAKCFDPRHGIRVFRGTTKRDYVICFECLQLDIFGPLRKERKTTTEAAKDVLNRVLENAKIDLVPDCAELNR